MIKSKNFQLSIIVFFLLGTSLSFGQKGVDDGSKYGHGEDSIRCTRGLALSHDFIKHRDYAMAFAYWQVTFDECPLASKNIYIDGVKMYKDFLEDTDDETRTNELLDTLMLIYDRRLKYFGEEGNVRGRQGVDLLRYGRDKLENIEKAYGYLDVSIELRGSKSSDAVLASYISSSIILYQSDKISTGEVIEDYLQVSQLLDQKPGKDELKAAIDENFIEGGPDSCEEIISYFEPLLESKKEDVAFLRMLTSILRDRDCTESTLFLNASKALHPLSPSAESALNIAILAFKNRDYTESIDYYNQAMMLETNEDNKADYYYGIAACYSELDQMENARESARKAAAIRPTWGEPYILIGQLYADSKDLCSNITLPNAVYWVAVDMFNKAKSVDPTVAEKANSLILAYSKYYPNKEEAFFHGINAGESHLVRCWINETTRVRFD